MRSTPVARGTQRTVNTCDRMFKTGTDMIARTPMALTSELKDNLISLQGQLPLIATLLTQSVAEQTTEVVNGSPRPPPSPPTASSTCSTCA